MFPHFSALDKHYFTNYIALVFINIGQMEIRLSGNTETLLHRLSVHAWESPGAVRRAQQDAGIQSGSVPFFCRRCL